jgi:mannosyl-oligosaccharide alpha-1,2-mannosidase
MRTRNFLVLLFIVGCISFLFISTLDVDERGFGLWLKQQRRSDFGSESGSEYRSVSGSDFGYGSGGSLNVSEDIVSKQLAIKEALRHAYVHYQDTCMGRNEIKPVTKTCHDWLLKGLSLTTIDCLDSLLIMGLNDEFESAVKHLKYTLTWNLDSRVSVFEITIRCLGGLLTAYEMTNDKWFLRTATELADRLIPAFDTQIGIPRSLVNLKTSETGSHGWSRDSILSEFGTLQLEFTSLSLHTKNPIYRQKVERIYDYLRKSTNTLLLKAFLNVETEKWSKHITMGGYGDSYYEYLLKYWLLFSRTDSKMGTWYIDTANEIIKNLAKNVGGGRWMLAEKHHNGLKYKMEHLGCFAGGMFALGAQYIDDEKTKKLHMEVAEGIGLFCWEMYDKTATGLSPEHVLVEGDGDIKQIKLPSQAGRIWLMRPEAIETWFILWRTTKKQKYREWGWKVFESIEQHSRSTYGYSGVRDVSYKPSTKDDVQQSFFLAETLKYLYLLFSPDDYYPLDQYVFNTEAHPLRIWPTV